MHYYIYCKRKEDNFIHLSAILKTQEEVNEFFNNFIKKFKLENDFDFWIEEKEW